MKNESVLQEVVGLVAFVRMKQQHVTELARRDKKDILEILEDIVTHSDLIMLTMLASPLTGRMNINLHIGITEEECQESLKEVLGV